MDILRESVEWSWEGPLAHVVDLPVAVLYGIVLTFAHGAGRDAARALREALLPIMGPPSRDAWAWRGRRLSWVGRLPAAAAVGPAEVTLRLGQRLKGRRLEELVRHLARISGSRDLRLRAEIRRHAAPGSTSGPALDG